jgi:hypothetical protein
MSLITVPTSDELQSYKVIAEVAASNAHWRKLGGGGTQESIVATILSVMLLARELGVSPMQAISGGINNIQGKFEISARIMNQLIRRHGHKLTIKMMTNEVCLIWGKRKDTGEEMEVEYHIQEALRSGLVKDGGAWKKVPTDMLFARAISRLARRLFPDCIGGCYIEGELQETIQGQTVKSEDVQEVTQVKNEIEVKVEPVILSLPEFVDSQLVDKFIQESAYQSKVSIDAMRKRANDNMGGFLRAFDNWKAKQVPQEEPELIEAII